jgi:ribosome recycling factor
MAIDDLIQDAARRMDKSVEAAQTEFATLRTGRASPALLDRSSTRCETSPARPRP